jgi:23S rRNA (uracil1939-C5)-methyltransferase
MNDPVVKLAARGDGITASGRFIAGVAPGDCVQENGSIVRGPDHSEPACRHYPACGGCQLQHVSDRAYGAYLVDRINDAMHAQGLDPTDILTPILSPPATRRRAALTAQRKGNEIRLGFNQAGSHELINLSECPVLLPQLSGLLAPLRAWLRLAMTPKQRAPVRMTLADQGVDLMVGGLALDGLAALETMTAFASDQRLARLTVDEGFGPSTRWEPEPVTISLGGIAVPFPEGAFLQATADGEAALVAAVLAAVGSDPDKIRADLFAGLGTFSLALPGRVHAVEGARDALLALKTAANRALRLVTCEHRDLFRRPLTTAELSRFDAIVIDPPRAGAKEQMAEIAGSEVPIVAAISCNPATFARDARLLVDGGYRLDWIQPVGQFRWSTHAELVARFSR